MSVVIIGGNECMERRYKELCRKHGCRQAGSDDSFHAYGIAQDGAVRAGGNGLRDDSGALAHEFNRFPRTDSRGSGRLNSRTAHGGSGSERSAAGDRSAADPDRNRLRQNGDAAEQKRGAGYVQKHSEN